MGDKIPASDKSEIEGALASLKTALSGTDTAAIKSATETLTQAFYKVSEKLYQQAAPQGDAGCAGDCNNCGGDQGQNYYDADYTVVDDDNK